MNFRALFSTIFILITSITFIACDDDLNAVGNSIQPNGDDITLNPDTVTLEANTLSFDNKIYARTQLGTLGNYNDLLLGNIKADYLCEFYCPRDLQFAGGAKDSSYLAIDSVYLDILFTDYIGDPNALMGIRAYELKKELDNSKENYYTDLDISGYYNKSNPLASTAYVIKSLPNDSYYGLKRLRLDMNGTGLGDRILAAWKRDTTALADSDKFKEILKGLYITNDYGSGNLVNVNRTMLNVYYKYNGRNSDNTADSIRSGAQIRFQVVSDVIQLNKVQNSDLSFLTNANNPDNKGKSYMKTPAGVFSEIVVPIGEIAKKQKEKGKIINSATFSIKGYTEAEAKQGFKQPTTLLLINKDSIENFFEKNNKVDNLTSLIANRDSTRNTYNFGNIALTINHTLTELSKDDKEIEETAKLHYYLMPVDVTTSTSNNTTETRAYHTILPYGAILRTDEENLRIPILFSKFNKEKTK